MGRYYSYEPEPNPRKGKYLLGFFGCSILIFAFAFRLLGSYSNIHSAMLEEVTLVISTEPHLAKVKAGRGYHYFIEFRCSGISKPFRIDGPEEECLDSVQLIKNVKYTDSVVVTLLDEDVAAINEMSFSSKHTDVYGFRHNEIQYIDLNCRNISAAAKSRAMLWTSIVGAVLCLLFSMTKKDPVIFGLRINLSTVIFVCLFGYVIIQHFFFE